MEEKPNHFLGEEHIGKLMRKYVLNRLGIYLLDHIIVAGSNAYSMRAHGDLNPPDAKIIKSKKDSKRKKAPSSKKGSPPKASQESA